MTHPLVFGLTDSPEVYIHQFDFVADRVLVIRLPLEKRKSASFLDDRILGADVEGGWAEWAQIKDAVGNIPPAKPDFIFHIGHCGSTLISKLIEDASGCHTMREPVALRTFAHSVADDGNGVSMMSRADLSERMQVFLDLTGKPGHTIIKATSICTDLIDGWPPSANSKAVFCYVSPRRYIATMLGGANNSIDLKTHAPMRLQRLRKLCGDDITSLSVLSPGQLCALSWACEAAAASAAIDGSKRIKAVNFDEFLKHPQEGLSMLCTHLDLKAEQVRISKAIDGPIMQKYSKDANFDYTPADREQLLAEYAEQHRADVDLGLNWLANAGKQFPTIGAALDRFNLDA